MSKMNTEIIEELCKIQEKNFLKVLKKYNLEQLCEIKKILKDEYYNKDTISLTDEKYDILDDYLKSKNIKEIVGAPPTQDNKVKLPFWLGSLDKIKPENPEKIERWIKKFPGDVIITPKFDGLSCLLVSNKGEIKMYTRGDGTYGSDVSHLKDIVKNIPKLKNDVSIRGELIINIDLFEKYSKEYKNARQLVSGIVNSKPGKNIKIAEEIEFIPYEIINDISNTQEKQLNQLKKLGFKIPENTIIKNINTEILTEITIQYKKKNKYNIDGIVITTNTEYTRNTKDNPDYSFAYKIAGETTEAIVEKIVWSISKWGLLKPVVYIKPIELSGITITKTSGFNGKFICDNNIGKNALIRIVRSGDVIPYIVEVIKGAKKPDMPDVEYKWNETEVDLLALDGGDEMEIAKLISFFKHIESKNLGDKTLEKIYNSGYTDIFSILEAKPEDFEKIDGFGKTLAKKIYDNIHNALKDIKISKLLGANGCLGSGVGERKINLILENIPDILSENIDVSEHSLHDKLMSIKGMSDKTTDLVLSNLQQARDFMKKINKYIHVEYIPVESHSQCLGKIDPKSDSVPLKVVFSGIRDKDLEKKIENRGWKVMSSVSNNTDIVIVDSLDKITGKIQKAMDLGKKVIILEDFKNEYDF